MLHYNGPDDEEEDNGDPGPSDDDFRGDKDSETFSTTEYDEETNRLDIYYGSRHGDDDQHGHIVFEDANDLADYVRDDEGQVYRDDDQPP